MTYPIRPNDRLQIEDCILDGEVCALDDHQMPSFAALQAALSENQSENPVFFAFDLLIVGTEDLRPLALTDRKARLKSLLEKAPDSIRYVEHFESTADTVLLSACKMHLEGIVSKKLDAAYASGRSGGWVKAKCRTGHEVVLGGSRNRTRCSGRLLAMENPSRSLTLRITMRRSGTGCCLT
jgi:bifunctional non-homologous end joining protein LigD